MNLTAMRSARAAAPYQPTSDMSPVLPPSIVLYFRSVLLRELSSTLRYCLIYVPELYLLNDIIPNYIRKLHITQSYAVFSSKSVSGL
jgi:hypothetical protein